MKAIIQSIVVCFLIDSARQDTSMGSPLSMDKVAYWEIQDGQKQEGESRNTTSNTKVIAKYTNSETKSQGNALIRTETRPSVPQIIDHQNLMPTFISTTMRDSVWFEKHQRSHSHLSLLLWLRTIIRTATPFPPLPPRNIQTDSNQMVLQKVDFLVHVPVVSFIPCVTLVWFGFGLCFCQIMSLPVTRLTLPTESSP